MPLCLVKEPDRIRKILDLKEFKNSDRRQQKEPDRIRKILDLKEFKNSDRRQQ
jgi:hypothetical protein